MMTENRFIKFLKQDHVEVTIRLTIASMFGYILGLASLPKIIPPSQASFIGTMSAFIPTMVPTLWFSVIMAAIPLIVVALFSMVCLTMLLVVSANKGTDALTVVFSLWVLWVTGLTFYPSVGVFSTSIMLSTILPLMGYYEKVQSPGGIDIIKGFWTETGIHNNLALVWNTMIAWCWIVCVLTVVPIIPRWRTARASISKEMLPSVLDDTARFIRLSLKSQNDEEASFYTGSLGGDDGTLETKVDENDGGINLCDPTEKQSLADQLAERLSRSAIMLTGGKLAFLTAFEPRLLKKMCCKQHRCTWIPLQRLGEAIRRVSSRSVTVCKLTHGNIHFHHFEVADKLEKYAMLLRTGKRVVDDDRDEVSYSYPKSINCFRYCGRDVQSQDNFEDDEPSEGQPVSADEENSTAVSIESHDNNTVNTREYDPYQLKQLTSIVKIAVREYLVAIDPPPEDQCCDGKSFGEIKKSVMPWIYSAISWFITLVWDIPCFLLRRSSWRNIFEDPKLCTDGLKAAWIIKFTIGATALFIMTVYWKAYKNFEVPTSDIPNAHFQGWAIIAYHVCSTQTSEGSVKKGFLRVIGTLLGGLSGWLCITACGDNVYGYIAWLTTAGAIATYVGTERGFAARVGLSKDHGYANQLFILVQATIVVYYANGHGVEGKNDLTANRIVATASGVGMAIVIALIPPHIWGGDPTTALNIVRLQANSLVDIIHTITKRSSETKYNDDISVEETINIIEKIKKKMESAAAPLFSDADSFLQDAMKFRMCPILKVDPRLKNEITSLTQTESCLVNLADFAKALMANNIDRVEFARGKLLHNEMLDLIEVLERDTKEIYENEDEVNALIEDLNLVGPPLFVEYVRTVVQLLSSSEMVLSNINEFGFNTIFPCLNSDDEDLGKRSFDDDNDETPKPRWKLYVVFGIVVMGLFVGGAILLAHGV